MKRKAIFIYILVLVLILAATLVYIIKKDNSSEKEIISSKESSKEYTLEKHKDGFVTYNGKELISYDTNMEQKWVVALEEDDAEVSVIDDYILLTSKETGRINLILDGEVSEKIICEKKLRVATVNENGYICALSSDKGYKGQCIVYGKNGKLLAEYSFGDRYILSAFLMKDNRTLVMNVIEDTEGGYSGKILYSDINSGEVRKEIVSETIYSYMNIHKNKVFVSDDKNLYCYDKNGNEKWVYSYDSKEPFYIGFSKGYITIAAKTRDSFRGNEIFTLNLSGRLKGVFESESQITAIDTSEGYSAAIINDELYVINSRGKVVAVSEADNEAEEIKLFKKSEKVLLLSDKAVIRGYNR